MPANFIPEQLKCDVLFLLVGENTLPNWVAAKLLLKPNGRVNLIYTKAVTKQAKRLKAVLEAQESIPVSWFETHHSDGTKIYSKVKDEAARIGTNAGVKIGLNYTGGTKIMSVHAHRAIRTTIEEPMRILSYLDAASLELKFDGDSGYPVAVSPEVRISVGKLLDLHGNRKLLPDEKNAKGTMAANGLALVHSDSSGHEIWKNWYNNLRKSGFDDQIRFPTEEDFSRDVETHLNAKRTSPPAVEETLRRLMPGYRLVLSGLRVQGGSTLLEVVENSQGDFHETKDLTNWFNGLWLEHYTLSQLEVCRANGVSFNDEGLSTNFRTTSEEGRDFQADVLALLGYRLYYFSCYSGKDPKTAKLKLFEAMVRAKQLGGEEARAAVVACIENPEHIRAQVEKELEDDSSERQFEVFGSNALPNLAGELKKWFDREKR
jgi:hypothetical protein